VYSAAVRAASNEAARGRRRKINNEKRFCELCLTHAPKKKGKRGDYMDKKRERERDFKSKKRRDFLQFYVRNSIHIFQQNFLISLSSIPTTTRV